MSCSEKIQFVKFIVQPNQLVRKCITNSIAMELIVQIGQLVKNPFGCSCASIRNKYPYEFFEFKRCNALAKSNIEMLVYVIMLVQD